METTTTKQAITIEASINAPVQKVYEMWNAPEHITKWCSPSPEWHTPSAENDLRVGGAYKARMEAKDGSMGFDFGATYDEVETNSHIAYTIGDGRKVVIDFIPEGNTTKIVQSFDPEDQNPVEFQRAGWQAILDSFKKYAESN